MTRRLAVVTAGLSQPSATRLLADRLAEATQVALERCGHDVALDVVELREHAHELTDNLLTGFPAPGLRDVIDKVTRADGLIAVTPVFTASYSGLFKTFFDVLEADSLADMPVLAAATGGTERHSLVLEHALRPLFTHLRAVVVPTAVYAASSDWGAGNERGGSLQQRIDRGSAQLAGLVDAAAAPGPIDRFADVTPFERLLTSE